MCPLTKVIWGLMWKHTVGISPTSAACVIMHLFGQAIWGLQASRTGFHPPGSRHPWWLAQSRKWAGDQAGGGPSKADWGDGRCDHQDAPPTPLPPSHEGQLCASHRSGTRGAGPGWTWLDVKWRRCSLILYHLSTKYMDDLVNLCTLDLWHIGKKIMHHCRQGDERPKTLCVLLQQPTEPGCCFKWGKILIHVKCDHLTFSCCARGWIF